MGKKLLSVSILLVISLILTSCSFFSPKEDIIETDNKNDNQQVTENIPKELNPEDIIGQAIEKKDASLCNQIKDEDWKNDCIDSVQTDEKLKAIIAMGDLEACENIEEETWKDICINNIKENQNITSSNNSIIEQASKEQNLELCMNIKDENDKQTCIDSVNSSIIYSQARDNKDQSICEKLENNDSISECKTNIEINSIIDNSVEKKDISMCDTINDEEYKIQCQELVNFSIIVEKAINQGNDEICKEIKNDDLITECKNKVEEYNKVEDKKTEILRTEKDKLYYFLEKKDSSICIPEKQDECEKFIAILEETPEDIIPLWEQIGELGYNNPVESITTYQEVIENEETKLIFSKLRKILSTNKEYNLDFIKDKMIPFILEIKLPNLLGEEKEKLIQAILQ